jgi:hypothetical protein
VRAVHRTPERTGPGAFALVVVPVRLCLAASCCFPALLVRNGRQHARRHGRRRGPGQGRGRRGGRGGGGRAHAHFVEEVHPPGHQGRSKREDGTPRNGRACAWGQGRACSEARTEGMQHLCSADACAASRGVRQGLVARLYSQRVTLGVRFD